MPTISVWSRRFHRIGVGGRHAKDVRHWMAKQNGRRCNVIGSMDQTALNPSGDLSGCEALGKKLACNDESRIRGPVSEVESDGLVIRM